MSDNLQHHGIKGQKWGVRRFQNADGSLTNDGKRRYSAEEFREAKKQLDKSKDTIENISKKRKKAMDDAAEERIRKDVTKLSDQDLQKIVNRLNMEERYTQVMASREAKYGKDRVETILDYAGKALYATGSVLAIMASIKELQK